MFQLQSVLSFVLRHISNGSEHRPYYYAYWKDYEIKKLKKNWFVHDSSWTERDLNAYDGKVIMNIY
jgi:hypothetical protein